MVCLGIDTSGKNLSVGLSERGIVLGERAYQGPHPHSVVLIDEIEALFAETSVNLNQVSLIAVSAGPGRYTALRVGMATAKAVALAKGIPLVRVSTLEAMARSALPTPVKTLCPVLDAHRHLVYFARFRVDGETLIRLEEDQALPYEVAASLIPLETPTLILGDGGPLILSVMERGKGILDVQTGMIRGGEVARLGEDTFRDQARNELYEGPAYVRKVEIHNPKT